LISPIAYKRIFITFCIYDLVALTPFFLPYLNTAHLSTLDSLNQILGGSAFDSFSHIHMLFVQMLGVLGTGWAVWRWRNFSVEIAQFEGILRLVFSGVFFSASFKLNMPLLFVFCVIDFVGGILHLNPAKDKTIVQPG